MNDDPPHAPLDQRADLQEFEANRADLRLGQFGAGQASATQRFNQHVSQRAEQQPELVGYKIMAARAVGKQTQLLLFDAVLHFATSTVSLLIKLLTIACEGGGDEAWVFSFFRVLDARDDPALLVPCGGSVGEFSKEPLLLAGFFECIFRADH